MSGNEGDEETIENADGPTVADPRGYVIERTDPPDPPRRLVAKTSMSALEVGEVIGEGGMGIVRTAVQVSLDRAVAIKVVHPGATKSAAEAVLREAWVTGYLEHPGVVPVHDIVKGGDGVPVVVMRKIDGVTWEDRLEDPSPSFAAAGGAHDALEANLRVLVRIAEIVEFAHAKGVIHRDIKPSNVMLGAFGEVYLLDWGLAVALTTETQTHLPSPQESRSLAGTLAYAAPKMVGVVEHLVSASTDIYLLGAVLFEILTGKPPHAHASAAMSIQSSAASPPAMPSTMPARLAAVCTRAMQAAPADRYESVAALRRDLLDFLRARPRVGRRPSSAREARGGGGEEGASRPHLRRVRRMSICVS